MGDRCWLKLTIRGHIDNLVVLEEVIEALEEHGLEEDSAGVTYLKAFANALAFETSPEFSNDEVNYGNIDEVEQVLQLYDIAYAVEHGSGDDYGPECWSWSKGQGRCHAMLSRDGGVMLDFDDVKKALQETDPLMRMKSLIVEAEAARGNNLPQFSVSLELKRHLATMLGVAALRPETV